MAAGQTGAPSPGAGTGLVASTVEALAERVAELARRRQDLREGGADRDALEQNRRALVEAQRAFCAALIVRHLPAAAA